MKRLFQGYRFTLLRVQCTRWTNTLQKVGGDPHRTRLLTAVWSRDGDYLLPTFEESNAYQVEKQGISQKSAGCRCCCRVTP